MFPLYPLLPQRSATLNCHMHPSTPFSIKGQHHSIVICHPSTPLSINFQHHSIVKCLPLPLLNQWLAPLNRYMYPIYSLLNQRSASLNCHMHPSTPFSLKGQHHSTVICPPSAHFSQRVSTTQLSYVPLYPLLPQRLSSLHCHMSLSSSFSINGQHHSTVLWPLNPLLPQRLASLNCQMPLLPPSQSRSAHLNSHMCPSTPFSFKG